MRKQLALLILYGLAITFPAAGQGEPDAAEGSVDELIERIVELQRQIDELKSRLPPSALEELRARLAEAPPTEQPVPEPAAKPAAVAKPATVTPPPPPPPRLPPAEAPGPLPLLNRRTARAACNTLSPLDENADGRLSSQDRYWRYLYLWSDKNRDGQAQEREIESVYDRGVREIAVSLETFIRSKGSLGEIRLDEHVVLDLKGDGFSERSRRDDGVLMVDATAVQRGTGPELLDPEGAVLAGFQPFRADLSFRDAAGRRVVLTCP